MGSRDDLHRLVDDLDDERLTDASELLRGLQQRRGEPDRNRPLSIIGLFEGEPDLAQRSSEILRRELGGA